MNLHYTMLIKITISTIWREELSDDQLLENSTSEMIVCKRIQPPIKGYKQGNKINAIMNEVYAFVKLQEMMFVYC